MDTPDATEQLSTRMPADDRLRNTDAVFRQIVNEEAAARRAKSERLRLARQSVVQRSSGPSPRVPAARGFVGATQGRGQGVF